MPLWKNKSYNLTENDIRYAMSNSESNKDAAEFLKIALSTYGRYAKMYIDPETNLSLWDIQKKKTNNHRKRALPWKLIINDSEPGGLSKLPPGVLKTKLLRDGIKAECCSKCGFNKRSERDFTIPLILIWIDGDKNNCSFDNLELDCYNCFYLLYGNPFTKHRKQLSVVFDEY